MSLNPAYALGILAERGGATSHTAIIAKSLGIPAILGIKKCVYDFQCRTGDRFRDAEKGVVLTDLDSGEKQAYREKVTAYLKNRRETQRYLLREACTTDGTRIEIKVNIGSSEAKDFEASAFSDGAGLFRSEFLYMEKPLSAR